MLLPNGLSTEKQIVGVDWSRKEIDTFDGQTYNKFSNLIEAASFYPNTMFVLEATGESFELQRRVKALDAFEVNDIDAYCFKTQRTAWFRKEHHIKKTTGAKDAKVIYRIATESKISLHRFKPLVDNDPIRDSIHDFLVEDRYLYDGEKTAALAKKYVDVVPDDKKEFLLSGKVFRKQIGRILAVAIEVRKAGRGYREFRRQIGNYSNGYPSMARSEFYHWWARMVVNARLKRHVAKSLTNLTPKQKVIQRQTLRELDRVAKWLWKSTEKEARTI